MEKLYIGVDLGGTNIAAGIVDKYGNILCKKSVKTNLPKRENILEKDIFELCLLLCEENGYNINKDIQSIGIGTPGSVDGSKGIVWSNVNFGYTNWKIVKNLEMFFNIPIYVENDANTAVIAEVTAGNAKNCKNALVVTLGTGVGGGAYVNGQLCTGCNYSALEIGHIVIEKDGRECNCGRKGCFERYASATALIEDTKEAMIKNKDSLLWEVCPDIKNIDAKTAFDAMDKGDIVATKVIENYIEYLSCGLVNLINIFQPEIICIGGGVSNQEQRLLDLIKPYIDKEDFARNADKRTELAIAKFKNNAGIIGAAMLGVNNA